ncbi:unnamed protein product [Mytilus edulis]|uniref:Endonuclease/exonuclease/phosphatase domain-containing protein n=1 Tax=Mytilus edulis TaxID=6550 RepID=A0A8S3TCG1_MYTED|nr:unnamed protein product [Mytilus edulis]
MADQSGEENKQTQINTMTIHPDRRNDESNTDNKLKRARSNENLSETEQETNKRLKKDDIGNELGELKTLMYDLAVEMKDMNDKVFERIDNLENTFAKNIVENISKMIDNKINKEVNKVKDDFKAQMTTVNKRIDGIVNKLKSDIKNIHTEVADKVRTDLISTQADVSTQPIQRDTKFVVKMLPETDAEKTDSELTKNRVSAIIRDGLRLHDVRVVEATRIESKGSRPGLVIASVENEEQKEKLMKSKIKLKYSRDYQKVYIENELTSEARVQLSNMMTVLNGIGREKDFVVVNGKIQKRANNMRGGEYDNVNGQRRPEREEWTPVQGRHFRGRGGRGSGGVAALVKNDLLKYYNVEILNSEVQDILWIKLSNENDIICLCVCYLPPENSVYNDSLVFYTKLLEQVYMYQNIGKLYICGDFNSRCGDAQDFIEGVDNVQIREIVDSVSNRNGDLLIEFLVDCNMCMVNGRIGSQDFTHIKGTGKSVVDYVLTPHEQLNEVINFKVNTMSDLVTELSLVGYESIPDHSLLEWGIRVRTDMSEVEQNKNGKGANRVKGPRKFKLDGLNNEPFSSENMQNVLRDTICRIEVALNRSKDVNKAFIELKHLLIKELELTCKELKPPVSNMRTNKCKRKPYWSEELQDSWNKTCDAERQWKRCKSIGKSKLRTRFIQSRKDFDKLNRKAKRNYQLEQQNKLQKLGEKNSSEFWKSIGKLGLANDRKSRQTFQIRSETGEIISDIDSVLEKWKIDYEKLYNSADMNGSYDDEFLKDIKNKLQNRNNLVNDNNIDTTELNRAIERDEVREAVFRAKQGSASNASNIAIQGDMGLTSTKSAEILETFRLFLRVSKAYDTRLTYKVHMWSKDCSRSWDKNCIKKAQILGIENVINDTFSIKHKLQEIKSKLCEKDKNEWDTKPSSWTKMLLFVVILQLLGVLDAYCTYYNYGYNAVGMYCTNRSVYVLSAPIIVVIALGALVGLGIFIMVFVCCRRGRRTTGVVVSGNTAQPTTGYIYPTNPNTGAVSYPGGNPPAAGYYGGNAAPTGYYAGNAAPTGYHAGNAAPTGYYDGNAAPAGNYGDNKPAAYNSAIPS